MLEGKAILAQQVAWVGWLKGLSYSIILRSAHVRYALLGTVKIQYTLDCLAEYHALSRTSSTCIN